VKRRSGHVRILLVGEGGRNLDLDRTALRRSEVSLVICRPSADLLNVVQREPVDLVVLDTFGDCDRALTLADDLKTLPMTDDIPLLVICDRHERPAAEKVRPDAILERPLQTRELLRAVQRFTVLQEHRFERYPVNLRFRFLVDGRSGQAFSHVVSAGGAFLKTDLPLSIGTRMQLGFHIPGDPHEIRCTGVVRNKDKDDPDDCNPGFGIEFEELSQADRRRLDEFLIGFERHVSGF
jgi:uncharacterized protein (TIGR02266 family)